MTVTCADRGEPPLNASRSFSLRVRDENDHAPRFLAPVYQATADEGPQDSKYGCLGLFLYICLQMKYHIEFPIRLFVGGPLSCSFFPLSSIRLFEGRSVPILVLLFFRSISGSDGNDSLDYFQAAM